jgi:aryl-alcohol dehydrogenase-like predicted oxidoreductase
MNGMMGTMDYTHLGRSGLTVSRLCLGTMNFGWVTDATEAHATMNAALRALDIRLDEKALARLDEIFPGHQPAPEDYAW